MNAPCEHFAEAISSLADGTLDPADRPRLEAHLEACDGCRALLDDLRALRRDAAALPPPPPMAPRIRSAWISMGTSS